MNLQFSPTAPKTADLIAVPVTSEEAEQAAQSKRLKGYGVDLKQIKGAGFKGGVGETLLLSSTQNAGNKNASKDLLLAVGVGKKAKIDSSVIRRAGFALFSAGKNFNQIASYLTDAVPEKDLEAAVQALAEGAVLGSYVFGEYKSSTEKSKLKKIFVVPPGKAASKNSKLTEALRIGQRTGGAVNFARDLVNEPGGSLTPRLFASRAQAMARKAGLQSKVWTFAAIKNAKLGGLLGVNRGSDQEPRFVELSYVPKGKSGGHLALVGKGITFDSGGLSLKPANAMMTMKCDMSGAAAVLGAMSIISVIKPSIKISAYIPMTDNMTGGDATRPGDVIRIHNKKTVEVLNTDAEGRLILADALSLASKAKPDAILDLATLTGACVVALGEDIAGLMGNNDKWITQIKSASKQTGERVWELPLVEEYRSQLDSPVADLKNIGSNYGGTITAGLFLQEFVDEKIPWAHLDIAGPAFKENGIIKGGTGFGVRLIANLAKNFKPPKN